MGWWTDYKSQAVIGDDPLDEAAEFLQRLARMYRLELGRLPSMNEFAALMECTLDAYGSDCLRDATSGALLLVKPKRPSKKQTYRVGDYVSIPLKANRFGCGQIMMISSKMGPLIRCFDYDSSRRPTLRTARAAKPIGRFYTYVSDTKIRNGEWRVVGNAPPSLNRWAPEFVMVDDLSDKVRGELVVADKVKRPARPAELKTLPRYAIVGSDLMAQRLASSLNAARSKHSNTSREPTRVKTA